MISHFLRFLARSLYFFCEPEERLQRQIYLLEREQGAEVRRLQQKHSDFWQRWQEDPTYPSRLATSRERILGQPCSVEQLREYYLKLFEDEVELLHRRYKVATAWNFDKLNLPTGDFTQGCRLQNGWQQSKDELREQAI